MELKTIGLTKKFGSKTAVDNLNITLTNGVYGLLGANGAGKTTLMRLLCNIQNPTSGKILLNGKNIVGLGERYRNLLGYLPQHFGYYPDFSAFDFLLYVSALKGLDEKAARKKSKELLEAVDLSRESKHKIKTFSGGMEQKGWIAVFYLPPVTMWKRLSLLISPAVRCSNIKFCWHLPVHLALRELHCSYLQSVKIRL